MKKILIIIAFFFCVAILLSILVFLEAKRQQSQNLMKQNQETIDQIIDINDGTEDRETYRNEEYGFQLTLPPELEKYSVEIYKSSDDDGFDSVDFYLPTKDSAWIKNGSNEGMLFSIICSPISIFSKLKEECSDEFYSGHFSNCLPVEKPIGQNDQYIFSFIRADEITDYPSDFDGELFDQVKEAIETFETFDE